VQQINDAKDYFNKVFKSILDIFEKFGEIKKINKLIVFYLDILSKWRCISYKHILELGCATGNLTIEILQHFPEIQITAIDFSLEMIKKAKQRLKMKRSFIKRVNFKCADIRMQNTYCDLESIDAVVSSLTLHHIKPEDKVDLFPRIFEILAPGGVFINGDVFAGDSVEEEGFYQSVWDFMLSQKLSEQEMEHRREHRRWESRARLSDEIKALAKAGFSPCVVVWRELNFAIIVCIKPAKGG